MTDVFPIIPAQAKGLWIFVGFVGLLLLAVLAVLTMAARGAVSSRFEISPEGLRLRGDIYGRLVPAAALRPAEARRIDPEAAAELMPARRTAGTALAGYQAGWFRLRNGEKALLYLTDRRNAVYVPTNLGFSLLLSPREPERFLERLRQIQ